MILVRILFIAVVLFLLFFGFLRLCFSKGFLTRERLRRWNRNATLSFFALLLALMVMAFFTSVDQTL